VDIGKTAWQGEHSKKAGEDGQADGEKA